jgi:uncharacterized protein (TIGR02145 family)
MRTKILVLFTLALVLSANLHAQVSIGDLTAPAKGALLDLNKTVKGGLTLSNVKLDNLYTIPSDFPGMSSPPADAKTKFTGAMVYHTGENNIVAGIYVWNGTNWAPVTDNCLPADLLSVTLTSSAVLAKTGDPVTFSVSTDAGTRCTEGETYDWYAASAYGTVSYTTVYPAVDKSISFYPANTYKVKVEASNIYSASAKATSNEVTVYVTDDGAVPYSLYDNNYDVSGPPCYDVYRSATEPEAGYTARADSFASGYGKTYLFVYDEAYSDLQVSYEDPHGLVDHIVQPVNKSSSTAPGKEPFTVVFKPDVKTSVLVSGRDTVKLLVSYKVGSDVKLALRNIRVQDAACHCPARVDRLSDRWLTFACHNLGGLDITSDSQTLGREHHGDWYRLGATSVSMANTLDHDTNNTWDNSYYQDNSDPWANEGTPPCPAGWRLPTHLEYGDVLNALTGRPINNTLTYHGTWSNSISNFSSYLKVNDYLYLPATGSRDGNNSYGGGDGSLYHRGVYGYYWSSTGDGWCASFTSGMADIAVDLSRAMGFSVRCVAAE